MHKLGSHSSSSGGTTTITALVDTKSVDVGSMFLMDLSVEESCEPDPADDFDCDDNDEDIIVEDDDFRELRQQQQQQQQQLQQQQQQQQLQYQQATKTITATTITIKPQQTASKTIVATSRNSSSYKHQQQQIVEVDDDNEAGPSSTSTSLESNETDIQMPPSNAVSYLSDHEFLEQEFNDNHHNHYSTDESDDEPLSAEDNPMKLFESIQALARSLHEDAELFGSLPPKRTLESPIRSLLLT